MDDLTIRLHILEASGRLTPFVKVIEKKANEAIGKIVRRIPLNDLDIIFNDNPKSTIPELGIGGYCGDANTVFIYLNPEFKNFNKTINEEIERTLTHESHHCLRLRTVGYGETLFEALISEGLADHFDIEVTKKEPSLWDVALTDNQIEKMKEKARKEYASKDYNHNDWFFGSKKKGVPKWTAYTLGYRLVDKYLKNNPGKKPSRLYAVNADVFK